MAQYSNALEKDDAELLVSGLINSEYVKTKSGKPYLSEKETKELRTLPDLSSLSDWIRDHLVPNVPVLLKEADLDGVRNVDGERWGSESFAVKYLSYTISEAMEELHNERSALFDHGMGEGMTETTARDFADNLTYCMMRSPSVESGVNAGYYTRRAQDGFASPCSLDKEAEHQPFSLIDAGEELGESMIYMAKHGYPDVGRAMTDLSELYRSLPAGVLPFYTNPEVCRDFSKQGEQIHDAMQVLASVYEENQKSEAKEHMEDYFDYFNLSPQDRSTAQKLYNLIQHELPQFYYAARFAGKDSPMLDLKEPVQNVMSLFSDYEETWFFGDENELFDLCFEAINHDKDCYRAAEALATDWFQRKDYPKATDVDFFEKLSDLNEAVTRFKNKIGGDDGTPQRELVRDPAAEAEAQKQLEEQKEAEKRAEERRAEELAQAQHNLEENRKRIEEENGRRFQYVRREPEKPEIDEDFER